MASTNLPLRWESTGDQWWFASPIDYAAANGHYDLIKHLLQIDANLLIKLTSLPRIRRLESVWDDEHKFNDVAKCRSQIARKLLQQCETLKGHNSLIRAGYGGWLLYTAASAGDLIFVRELLDRDPLLVFGEGEFRVTDILYAAARSKSCEVFRVVFDCCVCQNGREMEVSSVFRWEMVNRAVHAAARGGNFGILRELVAEGGGDVLAYRDAQGSTLLHSASGRGQLEVVKDLISSYDIIRSSDNQGNTALHVAAYRGHLPVVEVLISTSPSSASLTNNYGDTFLHMAVAGFRTPGFRRLDRQIDLMKKLLGGTLINVEDIINVSNNEGRTALHVAVIDNIQSDMVELLMSVRYIDLNVRDNDGNTPLDLLKQRPRSPCSKILIRRMISAGGISHEDQTARNAQRMHGIGGSSPGTCFRIPDEEIFSYTGIDDTYQSSCDFTSTDYNYSGGIERNDSTGESKPSKYKKLGSMNRLKILLRWPGKNKRSTDSFDFEENFSIESYKTGSGSRNMQVPLRHQFSRLSSIPTKKNFGSPSSVFSESTWSSPVSCNKRNGENRFENVN